VATEDVLIDGRPMRTLRELIRPGLKAVFIGINPSPVSVAAGHYYQGTLGLRLWTRLQQFGITDQLPGGKQDDVAFARGFGFADLVRRPTANAASLTRQELAGAVPGLASRIEPARGALAVFVFAKARDFASEALRAGGWRVATMPGPYASSSDVSRQMAVIRDLITDQAVDSG